MTNRLHVIRTQSADETTVEFWCGSSAHTGPQARLATAPASVVATICPDCRAALAFATSNEPRHTSRTALYGAREQRVQ